MYCIVCICIYIQKYDVHYMCIYNITLLNSTLQANVLQPQKHWHPHLRILVPFDVKPNRNWMRTIGPALTTPLSSPPIAQNLLPKRRHVWRIHPEPLTHQVFFGQLGFCEKCVLTNGWESSTILVGCVHTSLCCARKYSIAGPCNRRYPKSTVFEQTLLSLQTNVAGDTWGAQPRPFPTIEDV